MSENVTSTSVPVQKCIIHQLSFRSDRHDDKLIPPNSFHSWTSLLDAAKVRNYQPLLDIAQTVSENEVPNIVYQRYCRSIFTGNLKRLLKSKEEESSEALVWKGHHQSQEFTRKNASFARKKVQEKDQYSRGSYQSTRAQSRQDTTRDGHQKRRLQDYFTDKQRHCRHRGSLPLVVVIVTIQGQMMNNPARKCQKTQIQIPTKWQ